MKKLLICLMLLFVTACSSNEESEKLAYESYFNDTNPQVEIIYKDYGTIKLELFEEVAPNTVANFLDLVRNDFYDGLSMHRIISGFMIQGGDPNGDGTGGSENKIYGEFLANNFNNPLSHTRGVISMARSNDNNSASSQFFIVHEDSTFLDGNYASFGGVISGFDTLDKIANTKVNGETPVEKVIIEDIKITREAKEIKVPEYYSVDNYYNNEKNPVFISSATNPLAHVTLSDDTTFTIELFPKENKLAVDYFINLVNADYYDGRSLLKQDNVTFIDSEFNEVFADGEANDFLAYQGAVGFNRMLSSYTVIPNSSGQMFSIVNSYIPQGELLLNLFGFITDGFDNYLKSLENEVTIKDISLDLRGYEASTTPSYSLEKRPSSEFLSADNEKYEISLSNGDSFIIELFDESKLNANYFKEADLVGRKVTYLFKDSAIFFEGGELIEGSKAEIPFNGIENPITNDKYTIFMYYPSLLEGTTTEFGINLNDNPHTDNLYGVFAKVTSGTEVIDKLNNLETTENIVNEEITITSVVKK